jgi:hypothetical protein
MKKTLEKICKKLAKLSNTPMPIITKCKNTPNGYLGYEVRTEWPSYERVAIEFIKELIKINPNWIAENQGGCVYFIYKP